MRTKRTFSKYHARTISNSYGKFDSNMEWERFLLLKFKQQKGLISGLRAHHSFVIIPRLVRQEKKFLKRGIKIVERVEEQATTYTPDFVYYDNVTEKYICEEVKSDGTKRARDYRLRKVLMKWKIRLHNEKGRGQWEFKEVGTKTK